MALRGLQHFVCSGKKQVENKKLQVIDKTKDLIKTQVKMRKNLYTMLLTTFSRWFSNTSKNYPTRVIPGSAIESFTTQYKYNATCGSLLELLFFQRFWIKLSKYTPSSIMPSTLTALGLFVNIASFILLLTHEPQIPSWVSVVSGLSLFLYQTLDALDGKQAEKFQNTHLEELADHGSDSLSTSLITLALAIEMRLQPSWTFLFCLFSLAAFFSVHWQTHVSNVVVFGYIDVTEVQISIVAMHLLTAFMGQKFWGKIIIDQLEIRQLVVIVSVVCMGLAIVRNLSLMFSRRGPLDSVAVIPRREGISILYPSISFITWLFFALLTIPLSQCISPTLICFLNGIIFTKLLIKLQISTMGSTDYPLSDAIFLAPALLVLNEMIVWMPTSAAFFCILVYVITDLLRFVTYLAWDICDLQDIYIFSLKYPIGHPRNRAGNFGCYLNGINNSEILNSQKKVNGF